MEHHLFLFEPGIWLGEGKITFSYSQESFAYFTKWIVEEGNNGVVSCKQFVEISELGHKMENRFNVQLVSDAAFEIALSNEFVSKVPGKGRADQTQIFWEFQQLESLEGQEEYTRQARDEYTMRGGYCAQNLFRTVIEGKIWLKS